MPWLLYVVIFLIICSAFTYTSFLMTICASKKKRILNKDGSFTEKEILPVNITLDHRFMDGVLGAKMIKFVI
jgi:pyruvate/2-oxoglutarate dehydrogenase complex dihydrolipoamide acyltransferase (E2) component